MINKEKYEATKMYYNNSLMRHKKLFATFKMENNLHFSIPFFNKPEINFQSLDLEKSV